METKLAIVIPAYKADFFDSTLESIARQTNKAFNLYIGDDFSPNHLAPIVDKYSSTINISYHRFTENLGGVDLVAHWERCIDMTDGEEWIWLFSDDDIMGTNCVEKFYEYIGTDDSARLLHFNVDIIDSQNKVVKTCGHFPLRLSTGDFFDGRIKNQLDSFVVEYIFQKSLYQSEGGFQKFDLAWCSDDATWIKFGRNEWIYTIPSATVQWRLSTSNISSILSDKLIVARKLNANTQFLVWSKRFFRQNNISPSTSIFQKVKWALMPIINSQSYSLKEKVSQSIHTCKFLNSSLVIPIMVPYIVAGSLKRRLLKK